MAVSILETLENARYNFANPAALRMQIEIGKEQLNNAIELLDKGYGIYEEVEPLLEKYGDIEKVPEKD